MLDLTFPGGQHLCRYLGSHQRGHGIPAIAAPPTPHQARAEGRFFSQLYLHVAIHSFSAHKPMILSKCSELCYRYHNPILEHWHHTISPRSLLLSLSPPPVPGPRDLLSVWICLFL